MANSRSSSPALQIAPRRSPSLNAIIARPMAAGPSSAASGSTRKLSPATSISASPMAPRCNAARAAAMRRIDSSLPSTLRSSDTVSEPFGGTVWLNNGSARTIQHSTISKAVKRSIAFLLPRLVGLICCRLLCPLSRPCLLCRRIGDAPHEKDAAGPYVADQKDKRMVRSKDFFRRCDGFLANDHAGRRGRFGAFLIHVHKRFVNNLTDVQLGRLPAVHSSQIGIIR